MTWRVLRVLGAVALVALLYRMVFVYQWVPGDCVPEAGLAGRASLPSTVTAVAAPSSPIRVLSYNIAGQTALLRDGHLDAVARTIQEQQPDVVGLQEVHRGTWQSRFRDQAQELARETGMNVTFGESFRGARALGGGQFGNAILTRGEIRDVAVTGLPSLGEPRSLLRATIALEGVEFDFFVTHLAAWGGLNRRVRTRQASCVLEHARARAEGRRYVVCGDLNADPVSVEVATLLSGDLLRLCGLASDATHSLIGRRIDYILASPGWSVGPANVVQTGPSDHWPVIAELTPLEENNDVHEPTGGTR